MAEGISGRTNSYCYTCKVWAVELKSEAKSTLSRAVFLKLSIPIKDHNILNI